MSNLATVPADRREKAAFLACAATTAISLLVLLGWILGRVDFTNLAADSVPMNPITAILFVIAATAIVRYKSRQSVSLAASLLVLVAVFRLIAYLAGWDIGPDSMLFRGRLDQFVGGPNRMAPSSALAFLLLGLAIGSTAIRSSPTIRRGLAILTAVPALLAGIGFASGGAALDGVTVFIPMALPTVIGFILLGCALIVLPIADPVGSAQASHLPASKPLKRKIAVGFASALVLLALIGVAAYRNVHSSLASEVAAERGWTIRLTLADLLSALQDVETGQRGFLLSGDERYLQPYQASFNTALGRIDRLSDLVSGDADQLRASQALKKLAAEELAIASQAVELRRTRGFEAAEALSGVGKQRMDQIRSIVKTMQDREAAGAQNRANREYALAQQTVAVIYCVCAAAFLIVTASGWVINRDISARQKAEAERDRFFTMSLDLLCIAGFDGYFKRVNPAFVRTLGWTEEELTSRPWREFLHPDDVQSTRDEEHRNVGGGSTKEFENRYRCKDGSYRWLSWAAVPMVDDRRIYAAARDVTDRRLSEEKIQNLNRDLARHSTELEATAKELESFSYSVSHDLRAPLRSIDGFSQALLEDHGEVLNADGKDCLNRIRAAAQRMAQLIDDMLGLSRITRAEMRRESTDLSETANAVVAELRKAYPERNVEIDIPSGLRAFGDAHLLRIVLDNLIGNAWKFTGKVAAPKIEIGAMEKDGQAVYFVRDNGAGFDMAYSNKLFGAFQRLHGVKDFAGTGIGLATVQRVIHRHGGRVWAESSVGNGATFYFTVMPQNAPLTQAA
ncbi:MAG TPA: CHASE3 domain-containing protein [Tepidisphaeraceae bacterium]|nr:CHASE3 domain-containing protein [Tepidisphaeraceae bacterium]